MKEKSNNKQKGQRNNKKVEKIQKLNKTQRKLKYKIKCNKENM